MSAPSSGPPRASLSRPARTCKVAGQMEYAKAQALMPSLPGSSGAAWRQRRGEAFLQSAAESFYLMDTNRDGTALPPSLPPLPPSPCCLPTPPLLAQASSRARSCGSRSTRTASGCRAGRAPRCSARPTRTRAVASTFRSFSSLLDHRGMPPPRSSGRSWAYGDALSGRGTGLRSRRGVGGSGLMRRLHVSRAASRVSRGR